MGVDESLVRSLLREQHPDLADHELRPAPAGWDNQVWRLGEQLAVRLPRTLRAPDLLRKERQWLPLLAPRLPLPVPVPVRAGEPSASFPLPWSVVTWVPGEPADRAPVVRGGHAADRLAGFLRALHVPAPADAPGNPARGPLPTRAAEFEARLGDIADTLPDADVVGIRSVWAEALTAPGRDGPALWLHGDLHPANVLTAHGTLAGVIDFGDLCAGDPAADLAAAWVLLPEGACARFLQAYGQVDAPTVRRARGWAVLRSLSLLCIGRAWERGLPGGKRTWGPAGRAALGRVLAARRAAG
ncbi:aminoglycoside phosphotransferase family protein [Streptomyces sp. NPDC020362]|uniref:aminoglycoside phosphotransferase family protein n=1 Tax=unclassified Streptomyces TaxID=2593676 RepID=UPI0034072BB0